MTRKVGIVIGAVIVVVAVAVVVWWVALRGEGSPDDGGTSGGAPASEAEAVAQALELLETDPEQLLPAELQGSVDLAAALPPGTQVEADPASWTPSEAGGGLIEMQLTLEDGTSTRVIAVMAQADGEWKVLQTIPLEGA